MTRFFFSLLFFMIFSFSSGVDARQSGGGEDLEGVCKLAGGKWTGQEGGNWACCWENWGCYGCYNGVCKMQCRTRRCRDANRLSRTDPSTQSLKGLSAPGLKAPIVPVRKPSH